MTLADSHGRRFSYLRLSVTDACHYRCRYCLPGGYTPATDEAPLTVAEIGRVARAFAGLGVWKLRLTGGEPTLRTDLIHIARVCAATPGITRLALSTNGWNLATIAAELKAAGVAQVNVSLDTLDRARFKDTCGQDDLPRVLAGLDATRAAGLVVKVNCVLMKGVNDAEIPAFLDLARREPIAVRFIELMPAADNIDFFTARHIKAETLIQGLAADGWREEARAEGDGPARRFSKPGHAGGVGVIAPYAKDFCSTCNRLRVTSRGALRLCLFAEGDASLRHLLGRDEDMNALQDEVRRLVGRKDASHYLPDGIIGSTKHFAAMGG